MIEPLKIFPDPLDPSQTINSFQALVGLSNTEMRTEFLAIANNKSLFFYDLYRNPEVLLPIMFQIPAFFIFIDYPTYKLVEENLIAHFSNPDEEYPTPVGVYWAETIFDHPLLFSVDKANDEMMACFWSCKKLAQQAYNKGKREQWN